MTAQAPDLSQYEAVVKKNWAYYGPRFERFARGAWISWNWPAFFVTFAWLRYRRLYAWSWLYFFSFSTPFLISVSLLAKAGDACERALEPQGSVPRRARNAWARRRRALSESQSSVPKRTRNAWVCRRRALSES